MEKLIESYFEWLKDNTKIENINEYYSITTPFVDRHNDCIQFYIKKESNGKLYFTDDGYTLNDLENSGISVSTGRRKKLLEELLKSYQLTLYSGEITARCSEEEFAFKKHSYIQGLLAINDLYYINKSVVRIK